MVVETDARARGRGRRVPPGPAPAAGGGARARATASEARRRCAGMARLRAARAAVAGAARAGGARRRARPGPATDTSRRGERGRPRAPAARRRRRVHDRPPARGCAWGRRGRRGPARGAGRARARAVRPQVGEPFRREQAPRPPPSACATDLVEPRVLAGRGDGGRGLRPGTAPHGPRFAGGGRAPVDAGVPRARARPGSSGRDPRSPARKAGSSRTRVEEARDLLEEELRGGRATALAHVTPPRGAARADGRVLVYDVEPGPRAAWSLRARRGEATEGLEADARPPGPASRSSIATVAEDARALHARPRGPRLSRRPAWRPRSRKAAGSLPVVFRARAGPAHAGHVPVAWRARSRCPRRARPSELPPARAAAPTACATSLATATPCSPPTATPATPRPK